MDKSDTSRDKPADAKHKPMARRPPRPPSSRTEDQSDEPPGPRAKRSKSVESEEQMGDDVITERLRSLGYL